MSESKVIEARVEHCRLLASTLDAPAGNFIRTGWGVEPLEGIAKAFRCSSLCWSVSIDERIAAMFGCAAGSLPGIGAPWLVTAPEIERVKLRFIRQSRGYARIMLEQFPVLTAHVYRGNKPLIGWMRWMGFAFEEVDENFIRGELRAWDCQWL